MLRRRFILGSVAVWAVLATPVAMAQSFSWDGTWSGRAGNGRSTAITIAKGKVVSWRSNGEAQRIASSSVGKSGVSITHAGGATVRLTPRDERSVTYVWKGSGGASSTVVLTR